MEYLNSFKTSIDFQSKDEAKEFIIKQGKNALNFAAERPLWVKLSVATSIISYGYIRYKWTALNGLGYEIIEPSLLSFGTAGHYAVDDGFPKFGKEQLIDKGRKTVAYYRLTDAIILSIDPEIIKLVFTTHFGSFYSRMPNEGQSMGLGKDFSQTMDIVSNPHVWKRQRNTMAPGFTQRQLSEMIITTNSCIDSLCSQLVNLKGEGIDTRIVGGKFAIDAFLQSAFSVDLNEEFGDIRKIQEHPFVKHFMRMLNPSWTLGLGVLIPGLGNFMDFIDVPIDAGEALSFFKSFCKRLMGSTDGNAGRSKNFLNMFVQNRISNEEGKTATKGFTDHEIIGNTFLLLAAGYETTATLQNFLLYEIARNQDLQEKIRDEVRDLDLTNVSNIDPSKMPYVCATMAEGLRVHSPVGLHLRRCNADVELMGYPIKKGMNFEVPVDTLHFATEFWGEDAGQFRPERFIEDPNLEKAFFYLPFGAGPRNCIGLRFAQLQSRLLMARLVKEFQIDLADGFVDDVKQIRTPASFIKPSKTIEVKFTKL